MTDGTDDGDDGDSGGGAEAGERRRFDGALLSDLSVNAVPIAILVALVAAFAALSPGESAPLLLFHGALIAGVVVVSAVAAWAIRRADGPLRGSAADAGGDGRARSGDDDGERAERADDGERSGEGAGGGERSHEGDDDRSDDGPRGDSDARE